MHTGVRRSIVNKNRTIFISYPAIGKQYIRDISDTLFSFRRHKEARRRSNHFRRIFQGSHIHIQHITQTGCTPTYTVRQVQPSLRCLNRMRAFTIFHLFNCMVITPVDYRLFLYFRTSNIIYQGPTDTTATSGIYKTVLRTGTTHTFHPQIQDEEPHSVAGFLFSNPANAPKSSNPWCGQ